MHSLNKRVVVIVGGCILALALSAPPTTWGGQWDKLTHFSLNQSFEVPGMTLAPNTKYVMRLHDIASERNVVQVLTDDEQKLLTQFMAIPDYKLDPVDKTEFSFYETAPGFPKAIRTWFYPGSANGLEFIYPKEQLAVIASHRVAPATVQTASVITSEELPELKTEEPEVQLSKPSEPEVVPEQPAIAESQPVEEQPTQIAQNENQAPVSESRNNEELPRTAGELPSIGLIGILCLGFGLGLRVLSARS